MAWDWVKRWFKKGSREPAGSPPLPGVGWLAPADNPWGVPVLDVRPVTLGMLSTSRDQQCAVNALSFQQDDGTGFVGVEPPVKRTASVALRFRVDRVLADGALFLPREMEHKWALYFHRGQIFCIRSWLRQVQAVAQVQVEGDVAEVTAIQGVFAAEDEEPAFTARVLDYLLRSHALGLVYPAPLPPGMEADPPAAALWCMSCFGNQVQFATASSLPADLPERPLRTYSLLHIAVARGDRRLVEAQLDAGMPADLLDRDGLAPLHWGLTQPDAGLLRLLLERGSPVDVRSADGATPLMNAVQARSVEQALLLLDHGADTNAADQRGFTALHRAAEMGQKELVQLLLDRGAAPHPEAQGHTPRSLAEQRGERAIVELLDRW